MAVTIYKQTFEKLGTDVLENWRSVPVAVIGDELNRSQMMQAAIKPVKPGRGFAGQAVTVRCNVGDNLPLHHAASIAPPGWVIVADARGHEDTAVWGGILHEAAAQRKVAGVVLDGALRDVAEIRNSSLPAYCRAVAPTGPHKGVGGEVNGPIQCGGVAIRAGDLVIGDDDGVVVVRLKQLDGLYEKCLARMKWEEKIMSGIRQGKSTIELLSLPEGRAGTE